MTKRLETVKASEVKAGSVIMVDCAGVGCTGCMGGHAVRVDGIKPIYGGLLQFRIGWQSLNIAPNDTLRAAI